MLWQMMKLRRILTSGEKKLKSRKLETYRWISDLQITAGLKEPSRRLLIDQIIILRYVLCNLGCPESLQIFLQTSKQNQKQLSTDVESISWDDKTWLKFKFSRCWQLTVESVLTGEPDSTDLSLGKRKNESHSEWDGMKNLGKPWERNSGSSSQHNHNPWISWTSGIKRPILAAQWAHESGRFEFWTRHNDCTVCTMILQPVRCVQLY